MSEGHKSKSLPPPYRPPSPIRPAMWQNAADAFDPRMRRGETIGEMEWTPLASLMQIYLLTKRQLQREAPEALADLERMLNDKRQ